MFIGLHLGLARLTGIEELEISDDEGKSFMTAAQNVARHYSVQTTQKTMDWIAFAGVTASIYATRAVVIVRNRKIESEPKRPEQAPQMMWPNAAD